MLSSFFLSVIAALILGIVSALRPGGIVDSVVGLFAFAGISVPVFWLALVLILFFAVFLHWLPASGMANVGDGGFLDQVRHLTLPVLTLTLANTGQFTRYVRAAMIETLRMDFVRTAWAKGAGAWPSSSCCTACRNALIPVVTIMALSFGTLFSGALITETMFAQQGMGKMIYDSILSNDFNLALSGLLFATLITLLANLGADLAYGWLDPQDRTQMTDPRDRRRARAAGPSRRGGAIGLEPAKGAALSPPSKAAWPSLVGPRDRRCCFCLFCLSARRSAISSASTRPQPTFLSAL